LCTVQVCKVTYWIVHTTGEVLDMTHVARGVDDEGTLTVDVVMSGQVPQLPPDVQVTVLPYTEQYIQSGPGRSVCLSVCLSLSESI